MTVLVRRMCPDDWKVWRDVRLASLADAPYAFGSTLAREQRLAESDWRLRVSPENGLSAVAFVGSEAVGTIGIYTPETGEVLLIAAWVHPEARGQGVGNALIAEALDWCREHGHDRVELRVVDGNDPARNLFLRNGFTPTGRHEPLESDPSVDTEWLVRALP